MGYIDGRQSAQGVNRSEGPIVLEGALLDTPQEYLFPFRVTATPRALRQVLVQSLSDIEWLAQAPLRALRQDVQNFNAMAVGQGLPGLPVPPEPPSPFGSLKGK